MWPECHNNSFIGMVLRKAGALDGEGVGSAWMVWEPVLLNLRGRAAEICTESISSGLCLLKLI